MSPLCSPLPQYILRKKLKSICINCFPYRVTKRSGSNLFLFLLLSWGHRKYLRFHINHMQITNCAAYCFYSLIQIVWQWVSFESTSHHYSNYQRFKRCKLVSFAYYSLVSYPFSDLLHLRCLRWGTFFVWYILTCHMQHRVMITVW